MKMSLEERRAAVPVAPPEKIVQAARIVPVGWGQFIVLPLSGLTQYGDTMPVRDWPDMAHLLVDRIGRAVGPNKIIGWRLCEAYDIMTDTTVVRMDVWFR